MRSHPLQTDKLRFLIVDDSQSFCRVMHQMIESHAQWLVVAEAHDGQEAIRFAESFSPEVVLMDVVMPIINGIRATKQIRKNTCNAHIIMFSAYHEEEFRVKSLQAGADHFVWKEELTATRLEQMLGAELE